MYIITDKHIKENLIAGELYRLDLLQPSKIVFKFVKYSTDSIRGINLTNSIIDIEDRAIKFEVEHMIHLSARYYYMKDNNSL